MTQDRRSPSQPAPTPEPASANPFKGRDFATLTTADVMADPAAFEEEALARHMRRLREELYAKRSKAAEHSPNGSVPLAEAEIASLREDGLDTAKRVAVALRVPMPTLVEDLHRESAESKGA